MKKPTILVGISSGIASYKMINCLRSLVDEGFQVRVIMTEHAMHMLDVAEVEEASSHTVYSDMFESDIDVDQVLVTRTVEHITLADSADLMIVAPATANTIAKLAHGLADDYLSTVALAISCPLVVCPSMNVHMWNHLATQRNIQSLKDRGVIILGPDEGELACGYDGAGRLVHTEQIVSCAKEYTTSSRRLDGKNILVTSGGTREYIDDVRFISNRSTGKMGVAIAQECERRGARVTLLRAKGSQKPIGNVHSKEYETVEDLDTQLRSAARDASVIIHAAAVSDFAVDKKSGKITSEKSQVIDLIPHPKLLNKLKHYNPHATVIGFKAYPSRSARTLIAKARKLLKTSGADVIVVNDISRKDRGFESDNNEVYVVFSDGRHVHVEMASKSIIARNMVEVMIENSVFE